jgi:RHS repeat-associated protein
VGQPQTTVSLDYNSRRQRSSLSDPNYGLATYTYNPFGELVEQLSPKGQTTSYSYDLVGRMESMTAPEGQTQWVFDRAHGRLGTLKSVQGHGHQTAYSYDDHLRPETVTETINGTNFQTHYTYDAFGREETTTHPSGFGTRNEYNPHGYLKRIRQLDNSPLWQTDNTNALGQLTEYKTGNGLATTKKYEEVTKRLSSIKTLKTGQDPVQDLGYTWYEVGNLEERTCKKYNLNELFTYDNLNRLETIRLNGTIRGEHQYDPAGLGNIILKKADGQVLFDNAAYGENTAGPHALTSAETASGVFPEDAQSIIYNSFDKVTGIYEGRPPVYKELTIQYGHHRERISQQYSDGQNTIDKVWAGSCEYITENGQTTTLTYLSGPEGVFALYVKNPNGSESIRYIHKDHLGSWNTITDENGNLLQELSFDPWGTRRDPATWRAFTGAPPPPMFDRGFTGHEHLYGFQLINMNGRMYDPVVSRMLSPDNFIQAPDFSQSFNRYSYVWNNPLVLTDPSGEFLVEAMVLGAMINIAFQTYAGNVSSMGDFFVAGTIGAVSGAAGGFAGHAAAGAISAGGFIGGAFSGAIGGAYGGFIGGAGNAWASGANFGQGLVSGLHGASIGALTGSLFGGVTRGIRDARKGFDFWNGSRVDKFVVGSGSNETIGNGYNFEISDELLHARMKDEFGVEVGDFNIQSITTRTGKGFDMTDRGLYIKKTGNKTGELVGGYVRSYSTGFTDLHVSPFYATTADIVSFRAVAGHELIHAYHFNVLGQGNVDPIFTERVAYKYTHDIFANNGRYLESYRFLNSALFNKSGSFFGSFPSQYAIPSPLKFY